MNLGMIGAIGGAGAGLQEQGRFLAEQEKEDRADVRNRSLQDWLMKKREEYAIAGEQRQETRTIASEQRGEERTIRTEQRTDERGEKAKDRDFTRLQGEAPTRRQLKAEDTKSEHRAKSDAAAETLDQDVDVKKRLTEAGETQSTRELHGAQSEYYRDRGDAATGAAGAKVESEELKAVRAERAKLEGLIGHAKLAQTFDPKNPEHAAMDAKLRSLMLKERDLSRARAAPAAAPTPDPAGLRKPAAGASPGTNAGDSPGAGGPGTKVSPKLQGQRDVEAGQQIVRGEYGGDVERARRGLNEVRAELARATSAEQRSALQSHANILQAGIDSMSAAPAPSMVGPAPAVAPAPAPLAAAKVTPPAAAAPAPDKAAALKQRASSGAQPGAAAKPGTPQAALEEIIGGAPPPEQGAGATSTQDKAAALKARTQAGAAPAAPGADPVLQALGATGNNAISGIVAQKAPALRAAADKMRAAQAEVTRAAQSQNQQATQAAMAKVQAAAGEVEALLRDMNPAQAQAVKKALGVV